MLFSNSRMVLPSLTSSLDPTKSREFTATVPAPWITFGGPPSVKMLSPSRNKTPTEPPPSLVAVLSEPTTRSSNTTAVVPFQSADSRSTISESCIAAVVTVILCMKDTLFWIASTHQVEASWLALIVIMGIPPLSPTSRFLMSRPSVLNTKEVSLCCFSSFHPSFPITRRRYLHHFLPPNNNTNHELRN